MPSDEVIVSHESALLYHRARRLAEARGNDLEVGSVTDLLALLGQPKLDVLVLDGHRRPRADFMRPHIRTGLDPHALTSVIAPGVRVCSPEFALWELGCSSTNERASLLAYECCGTFAPDPTVEEGCLYKLPAICSLDEIADLASQLDGLMGQRRRANLERMIASTANRAASPAEARLCHAIVAPRLSGGFGLPKPLLNSSVELNDKARSLTTKSTVEPDGLWADKHLIYEYQGAVHATKERMESDAGRNNALLAMGYQILYVTKKQVKNYDLYRGLMESIRLALGVRKSIPSQRIVKRQYALWKRLFKNNMGE